MELQKVLHMNGDGDYSYANNSSLQVFLNDLPGNDFNSIFKLLPSFYERLKKEKGDEFGEYCFITAVPKSFYGRLFPSNSLHFIFSSFSVQWLSQVPKGLVNEYGVQLNKGNIYIAKTSPPGVHKAYLDQFESDFTLFLRLRAEELKPSGRMVLTLMGGNKYLNDMQELLAMAINDMVLEGLIEESKLDSYNLPIYPPYDEQEVRSIIERDGSFNIHQLETFHPAPAEGFDKDNKGLDTRGKIVASNIRAISDSLLASHFGESKIDDMFHRFSIKVAHYLETRSVESTCILITLIKK
ncbi:hypothetical protein EZV62_027661 [Acer yangbiense]|uniref:Uncharacterized protein n=1 Tax=Acer yangbiense TaxID=1000413 RepID=A0A5C7GV81_9ROSI|nr:hypothetical protein EZV62_027661 [Acer yangbiense]